MERITLHRLASYPGIKPFFNATKTNLVTNRERLLLYPASRLQKPSFHVLAYKPPIYRGETVLLSARLRKNSYTFPRIDPERNESNRFVKPWKTSFYLDLPTITFNK